MVDWQEIVRRVGRSRSDFSLITWNERMFDTKVIRLVCNCCGAWAQQALSYEVLVGAYYQDYIFADTIERLTLFMLGVNTDDYTQGVTYVNRRTITRGSTDPS